MGEGCPIWKQNWQPTKSFKTWSQGRPRTFKIRSEHFHCWCNVLCVCVCARACVCMCQGRPHQLTCLFNCLFTWRVWSLTESMELLFAFWQAQQWEKVPFKSSGGNQTHQAPVGQENVKSVYMFVVVFCFVFVCAWGPKTFAICFKCFLPSLKRGTDYFLHPISHFFP